MKTIFVSVIFLSASAVFAQAQNLSCDYVKEQLQAGQVGRQKEVACTSDDCIKIKRGQVSMSLTANNRPDNVTPDLSDEDIANQAGNYAQIYHERLKIGEFMYDTVTLSTNEDGWQEYYFLQGTTTMEPSIFIDWSTAYAEVISVNGEDCGQLPLN